MARAGDTAPLGMRLSLAFVSVALFAVAVLAVLVAFSVAADVQQLSQSQRVRQTHALATAVGTSRAQASSWARTDLSPAMDLAAALRTHIRISDLSGALVAQTPGFGATQGAVRPAPVVAAGHREGSLQVRFGSALAPSAFHLRGDLWRAIASAAGLAAVLALLVAIGMSRRITRPVVRLIQTAKAVGAGDQTARVGSVRGPPELADLARTFDQMADTLARQEQLRRYLVADVAHELRTPVAVLQAGHEALLDGVIEPGPAQLASLRDEVLRLARMVDDLQTLAAAEAAAVQLSLQPGDLAEMAAAAADSLATRFESSQLVLELRLAPAPVHADERWMHVVITNLLGNSLKFTPAGGRVTLSTAVSGDHSTLTVADTGVGIAADELPHVLERFWRGTNPTGATGSGIGLAIVAELVRGHNGDLQVRSEPGAGTLVMVSMPRG